MITLIMRHIIAFIVVANIGSLLSMLIKETDDNIGTFILTGVFLWFYGIVNSIIYVFKG